MNFDDVSLIADAGFKGFETFHFLWESKLKNVPEEPGVYMVVRSNLESPKFLQKSRAGPYKGNDPSLPISELERVWVPKASVLYIGKAGGTGITQKLKRRLSKYVRTGFNKNAARRGGILIWQIEDSANLQVCWKHVINQEPKDVEGKLLQAFIGQYGKKPFANR